MESHVRAAGDYGILEDYTGHGIGIEMHQPPDVPNFGRPGAAPGWCEGLALAVEPMVTLGSHETDLLDDDWTVVTVDRSWAAHSEHTFTLTDDGAWVLTALDGGRAAGRARRAVRRGLTPAGRVDVVVRGPRGRLPRRGCLCSRMDHHHRRHGGGAALRRRRDRA